MNFILHIETTTHICSVALSEGNKLIALKESDEERAHARILSSFIQDIMDENGIKPTDLKAVAVSKGPGSYTGLRIGVATAKGLCYALGIPLVAINTLEAMTNGIINQGIASELYVPMLDARRMEVYSAVFNPALDTIRKTEANIIDENSFKDYLVKKICFFGTGAAKCKGVIIHPNAFFMVDFNTSAKDIVALAYTKFLMKDFEDLAYFEPFYLKEFLATIPKKNIFK